MKRRLICAALVLPLLGGCASWFEGSAGFEPTPLQPLAQQSTLKVQWQASVPAAKGGLFTPFYDQGLLWVAGGDGKVSAINVLNGSESRWFDFEQKLSAGVAIADKLIFAGNEEGKLIAANLDTGKVVWEQTLTSVLAEPPQVGGKAVVTRSNDGRISAFDIQSGRQLWTEWQPLPALTVKQTTPQLKVEGDDVLLVGSASGKLAVYALEQGRMLWEAVVASPRGASELERVTDVVSQPVFDGRRVCAVAYQGRIGCFEARGGEQAWARELASSRGLSMDAKGVYSTADDGSIWAFDPDTGRNLWKQDALRYRNVTAPVKLGNNLLAVDGEGYAHLLSPVDGQIVGRSQLKVEGTIARPLVLGNIAYVLDTNGTLSAVTL